MRAATLCNTPGCTGYAVWHGRCDRHRRRISQRPWSRLVRTVVARDNGICWLCKRPGATSADHIRRVVDGGRDEPSNLRAVHVRCNQSRG